MKQDQNLVLPKRKRDPSEGELDITPMIDIVFLLLAFFVVVSRLDPQASVPLPLASHADSISEKNSVMFIVVDDGSKEVAIYKGRAMEPSALLQDGEPTAQEQEIGDFIEQDLSANPSKDAILVKAAGDIRLRYIELIKRGVDKSELAKSKKIYFGVKEED